MNTSDFDPNSYLELIFHVQSDIISEKNKEIRELLDCLTTIRDFSKIHSSQLARAVAIHADVMLSKYGLEKLRDSD